MFVLLAFNSSIGESMSEQEFNGVKMVTEWDESTFNITLEEESDISTDGGYTFETVSSTYELDKEAANHMVGKLNEFIKSISV